MHRSALNLAKILEEINTLPFKVDGSNALMAFPPSGGVPIQLQACPEIMLAIMEIIEITGLKAIHVMINKLPPGVGVPIHTDTLKEHNGVKAPKLQRWHLPIKCDPKTCYFWDEDNEYHYPEEGRWFGPVKFWRKHSVGNRGAEDRVHLVVDLA